MRYRLRTLMILAAVAPPLLAALWLPGDEFIALIGLGWLVALFVVWFWMLCRSQANPKFRGEPKCDGPGA